MAVRGCFDLDTARVKALGRVRNEKIKVEESSLSQQLQTTLCK